MVSERYLFVCLGLILILSPFILDDIIGFIQNLITEIKEKNKNVE